MIYAVISDIHGNLAALQAVLKDMVTNGAERVLCLGDVVGYGPQPGECLDLLAHADFLIMGNHEEAVLHGAENFNPRAKRAIEWTRDAILEQAHPDVRGRREAMLNDLKLQESIRNYSFTHGSPRDPTREYVMPRDARNKKKMLEIFALVRHICFAGHTHLPGVFLQDGTFTRPNELWANTYFVEPDEKAFINVGSVGQPRDGDTRACYVLLDEGADSRRVIYRRVEYDLERTAQLIEQNEFLDNYLADRLRAGR
jgi:predicted phosphodiesterase